MLPESIHNILIGSSLGDASIERNGKYCRVRFGHSIKEKKYVEWKYNQIKSISVSHPKIIDVKDPRTSKIYYHVRFNTRTIPELEDYYKMFYPNGKKIVPLNIRDMLKSRLSMAVWYMDDGHRRTDCNAIRINTQGFQKLEVIQLIETIKYNFEIHSTIHRSGKSYFVIYIGKNNAKKFCNLIRPYVLPSMEYKLL